MESYSITDIGKKRTVNQDYLFCTNDKIGNLPNLYIVADGMGGHKAGDYASKLCVETMIKEISKSTLKTPIGILEEAIAIANLQVYKEAAEKEEYEGMGTTLVAAAVFEKVMYVANIGDSRLYIIDETFIKQITEDHSLVEELVRSGQIERKEARFQPNKNIITRALGTGKHVSPDYFEVELKDNQIVLLCSDGLSNMIEDEEIYNIIRGQKAHLEDAAGRLVYAANEYGGNDNIAVILVKR